MKKIIAAIVSIALLLVVAGCDNKPTTDNQSKSVITVGVSPGPYSQLFLSAIKPILEKEGYTIKEVDFSNLRLADVALNDGDIDLNVDQHTAYYQDFNKNVGGDLIGITPIPTVPAGIYQGTKKSLANVAKGDKVAIPQDASNMARAYVLLQKAGWITLREGINPSKATANDIVDNKYGIDIIEVDSATIPRSLPDLAYAVIPGSIVYSANIDPNSSLLQEDVLEHLVLVATVKQTNKDTPWAKAVVAAYHSDEFKQYLKEHNKNNYWFIPESLR